MQTEAPAYKRIVLKLSGEALQERGGRDNISPAVVHKIGERIREVRDLGVVVETDGGHQVPVAGIGRYGKGSRGLLVLRPELLSLTESSEARGPGLPGVVTLRVFEGARHLYEVDIGAGQFVRVELSGSLGDRIFRIGDRVRVETSSDTVVIVPES